MNTFAPLAHRLADTAGTVIREYFRQPFEVISKADESPVTIADRMVEQRLREILEDERPDDGIYGEEFGVKESKNGLTWVLDPIDGTKSFVIGRPTFGTLIALCEDGVPKLGVIDQPILHERWIGVSGAQTLFNGRPARTRPCKTLKDSCAGSTTPAMFSPENRVYERLDKSCGSHVWGGAVKMLAWGGDCYMYGLLASGHMDVCVEASLSPYDFCALVPVVEGAGGVMSDWNGKPLTIKSDGHVVAVGDAALKDAVLGVLKS